MNIDDLEVIERAKQLHDKNCDPACPYPVDGAWLNWAIEELEAERNPPKPWYHDEDYSHTMPAVLSDAVARFYGKGTVGINFAQSLNEFINNEECRRTLRAVLDG